MKLSLIRDTFTEKSTIGKLYVNEQFSCYTLEDVIRKEKIEGKTAIPSGEYQVIIDFSVRLQKELPHILDVPGFSGIRIHRGNTPDDTEGCILVGVNVTKDRIWQSNIAFTRLFDQLEIAYNRKEPITIQIL